MRGKQVEELHGKDICNSGELKSQKQKQSQYQKSMDQTLNAKMLDENNETFKHDTEFHESRTAVAAGADPQHARMAQSPPRPSGKASSSTSTSLTRPVRTTQFSQRRRWKNVTDSHLETSTKDLDRTLLGAG